MKLGSEIIKMIFNDKYIDITDDIYSSNDIIGFILAHSPIMLRSLNNHIKIFRNKEIVLGINNLKGKNDLSWYNVYIYVNNDGDAYKLEVENSKKGVKVIDL
jgi:hypothetical protein